MKKGSIERGTSEGNVLDLGPVKNARRGGDSTKVGVLETKPGKKKIRRQEREKEKAGGKKI